MSSKAVNIVSIRALRTILALCAMFALWSCSKPQPNIVIIVLDTTRPDYLSAYGHPRPTSPYLETFAKAGTRYDRAYSVSNWTLPSHGSMFSGRRPEAHGATQANPKICDAVPMMAEKLAHAGYQTTGFSNNPWVAKHTGLARGFADFDENANINTPFASDADEVHKTVVAMKGWFEQKRQEDKPFFAFVNLIEPHMPYTPPWEFAAPFLTRDAYEDGIERFFPDPRPIAIANRHYSNVDPLTSDEWSTLRALYEGELRLVDDITRQLMEIVDAHSDPKETFVFIVSDHGENIGDHGHLTHIFNLYDSNLRIVCLARGPGFVAGADDNHLVQITDIYPTVMKAAGLSVESNCDGLDLRGELPVHRTLSAWQDVPVATMSTFTSDVKESGDLDRYNRELFAAIGPRFKAIRSSDDSQELYDLRSDPNELVAIEAQTIGANVLKALLDTITAASDVKRACSTGATLDPAARDRLNGLGYIGDEENEKANENERVDDRPADSPR
jgi:arylsulfatase A-like enzyme